MSFGSVESQMNWESERPVEDFLKIIDDIKEELKELSEKTQKDQLEILDSIGFEIDLETAQKEGIEEYLKGYTYEELEDIKDGLEDLKNLDENKENENDEGAEENFDDLEN